MNLRWLILIYSEIGALSMSKWPAKMGEAVYACLPKLSSSRRLKTWLNYKILLNFKKFFLNIYYSHIRSIWAELLLVTVTWKFIFEKDSDSICCILEKTLLFERFDRLKEFLSTYFLKRSERLKNFGSIYKLERSERLE